MLSVLVSVLVPALVPGAGADPCALRALVAERSENLVPLVEKAGAGRDKACHEVVAANALSREGHGSDAARLYDDAAGALPEIASFLDLAKKRALAPPAQPPPPPAAPKDADEAAAAVGALLGRARAQEAAKLAVGFPRDPKAEPPEALEVATVTALVRAGRVDEALAHAAALPLRPAFLRVRAWALAKANRTSEARDVYARLAASAEDPALKAEGAFYAGFTSYEAGDLDDAKARFAAGADAMKGSPYEGFGRWYTALADLLENKPADAVPVLTALVHDLPSDREVLKHRYWLGRAKLASGDKNGGKAELRAVAALDPIGYYGLLARRHLKLRPLRGRRVPTDAVIRLARDDDDAKKARLLWNLGLDDEARTLARGLGETEADIGLQQAVGDASFGWRRGARFLPSPRTSHGVLVDDPRWRVSYAAPWPDVVAAAAKKHHVAASFVYAIMRTESGFDPRAVSVAGARGVIQLLPSAARGACTLAGRPVDDAERIFEAPVAIDLGAALLAAEKRELGSIALAAAAYNGGATHVVEWMKKWGALDPELFIERIPFRETRDYVKRVLAVEATYRALDGDALSLDMPERIPAAPRTVTDFTVDR